MYTAFRRLISLVLIAAMLFSLGFEAFAETLTLPAALEEIGEEAFFGDESLDEVVVPYGATSIGPRAFANSGVKKIYIPDTVTEIAADAFEGTEGLTILASADSYAFEYSQEHTLSWEGDNAFYVNEQLAACLALTEGHDDLTTLLPEDMEFDLASAEGVTDPVLLDLIERYNSTQTELQSAYNLYGESLQELADSLNALGDGLLDSGIQVSENGATLELSGVGFHYSEDAADIFNGEYTIVSSTIQDNGNILFEILSDGQTWYLEGSGESLTLISPDNSKTVLSSVQAKGFWEDSLAALESAVTNVQSWIDTHLLAIDNYLSGRLRFLKDSLHMEEDLRREILESLPRMQGEANVSRATEIAETSLRNINRYRALIGTVNKIVSWVSGISALWDGFNLVQDLDRINQLLEIHRHGHPTDIDAQNDEMYSLAVAMTQDLSRAMGNYIADAASNVLSISCDLLNLISTLALIFPGSQIAGLAGKLATLSLVAARGGLNALLCMSGIVTNGYADTYFERVQNADEILHSGILTGIVFDESTGNPLAKVKVRLDGKLMASTGADGTFRIDRVKTGLHSLVLTKSGYEQANVPITVTEALNYNILTMRRNECELTGTVTDEGKNTPIAGATVTLDNSKTITTGADGKYAFKVTESGSHTLSVKAVGYKDAVETITVNLSNQGPVDIPMQQDEHVIFGVVTDSKTGARLSGVKVSFTSSLDGSFTAYTDANGVYSFTGVSYDTYRITFNKPYYATKSVSVSMNLVGYTKKNVRMDQKEDEEDPDVGPGFWDWCVRTYDTYDTYDADHDEWIKDGKLSRTELSAVTDMSCPYRDFTSLKGIENFPNLTTLNCSGNRLTSLNLSGCSKLTTLNCSGNRLTGLNLSGCSKLTTLNCSGNRLTSLNLSGCSKLTTLDCSGNRLTSFDLSGCSKLTTLNCSGNQLTSLDLSGYSALTSMDCDNNELTSLNLSGCSALNTLEYYSNPLASINLSGCSSLTYFSHTATATLTSLNVSGCSALTSMDCDNNQLTSLNASGCSALTTLICFGNPLVSLNLSGCSSLTSFSYSDTDTLTSLNVSGCSALTKLECYNDQLTSLNVFGCSALTKLECYGNQLTSLNVFGCSKLTALNCFNNQLTSLNASGCSALTSLYCSNNQLTGLNLSGCSKLTTLHCGNNQLTNLNLSGYSMLTTLECYNNPLVSLNLSGCSSLTYFSHTATATLTSLNVSRCSALTELYCYNNQLTSLNVSGCSALTTLCCYNNQLTSLDLSGCSKLTKLQCFNNQLTSLDLSGCSALTTLECSNNQLTRLDLSGCFALKTLLCNKNQLTSLDLSGHSALSSLNIYDNSQLITLNLSGCSALSELTIDTDNSKLTTLNLSGCSALTRLWCQNSHVTDIDLSGCSSLINLYITGTSTLVNLNLSGCSSLTALNYPNSQLTSLDLSGCSALTTLWCENNQLTRLNLSGCSALTKLSCGSNRLTNLDFSDCSSLTELHCASNQLTSLDLSAITALEILNYANNQLTSLDLSGCSALTKLYCYDNQLTSLDLSDCSALTTLSCRANQLANLDLSGFSSLTALYCGSNQLTSLDLSANTALEILNCADNQLTSLDLSGHSALTTLYCGQNRLKTLTLTGCTALATLMCKENQLTRLDLRSCPDCEVECDDGVTVIR